MVKKRTPKGKKPRYRNPKVAPLDVQELGTVSGGYPDIACGYGKQAEQKCTTGYVTHLACSKGESTKSICLQGEDVHGRDYCMSGKNGNFY